MTENLQGGGRRTLTPIVRVFAFWIVKHFDVFEHIPSGIFAGGVGFSSDLLAFQQLEEALGDGVVITVPASTHAGLQIVLTVRRHINWNTQRPDLKEYLAHLVDHIKRRICGIASAGFPSFCV